MLRTFLKWLGIILLLGVLTVLTQVGGIILLCSMLLCLLSKAKGWRRWLLQIGLFSILYLVSGFFVVPYAAKSKGRVPLPLIEKEHVGPANKLTFFLFRNYVRTELKETTFQVANKLNEKYPQSRINYLDAGFPFYDGFPLLPHLSHDDGKKLDVSFFYRNESAEQTNKVPSFIGYGVCEEPVAGEEDRPAYCDKKGYWRYSFMRKITSQSGKQKLFFDAGRTKEMVDLYAKSAAIGKMFIEPHLMARLNLKSSKIRFHGCQAVRHDDHLHVQLY